MKLKQWPTTRSGWAAYYAKQFNQHGREEAARLAMWYQLLALAFGE